GVVGVVRDVTERRAQEDRIVKLSRIRKLMSEANGAMVRIRERAALIDRCCHIAVEHGDLSLAGVLVRSSQGENVEVVARASEHRLSGADLEPSLVKLGTYFASHWLPEHAKPLVCNSAQELALLPGATRLSAP